MMTVAVRVAAVVWVLWKGKVLEQRAIVILQMTLAVRQMLNLRERGRIMLADVRCVTSCSVIASLWLPVPAHKNNKTKH